MESLTRKTKTAITYKEKVLQFGEGNFLRAFADWMIHEMNQKAGFDAGIVVVQPIENGLVDLLNEQNGLYTLFLNGIKNNEAISEHILIDCIQRGVNPYTNHEDFMQIADNPELRFVISNTTEAGIVYRDEDALDDQPQVSFPGKLTSLLFRRFHTFKGDKEKGLIIIPCELIDRNGDNLKKCILNFIAQWNLGEPFKLWIEHHNYFCNTLVDRIVPGYPKDKIQSIEKQLGYRDKLVVEGEQFHLWVIEGPEEISSEFPAHESGLNVIFTDDMEPYRTRKVRILNGAHTTLVPVGYLYGIDSVRASLEDTEVGTYLKDSIFNNICPTLDLPKEELDSFTEEVLDRFRNPYLHHELMSISLNSISKFKTRVLPSVLEYVKRKQQLPSHLLFSLASLIVFYKGFRNEDKIALNDNEGIINFFKDQWLTNDIDSIAKHVLSNIDFWGQDLCHISGLKDQVVVYMKSIVSNGMNKALKDFNQQQKN